MDVVIASSAADARAVETAEAHHAALAEALTQLVERVVAALTCQRSKTEHPRHV